MACRSRDADSGVRFFQKYCSALRPTTGMPRPASDLEIALSMLAQPPSPETKTTSVSEAPCVAGTSMSGSLVVVVIAKRSEQIMDRGVQQCRRAIYLITTETQRAQRHLCDLCASVVKSFRH